MNVEEKNRAFSTDIQHHLGLTNHRWKKEKRRDRVCLAIELSGCISFPNLFSSYAQESLFFEPPHSSRPSLQPHTRHICSHTRGFRCGVAAYMPPVSSEGVRQSSAERPSLVPASLRVHCTPEIVTAGCFSFRSTYVHGRRFFNRLGPRRNRYVPGPVPVSNGNQFTSIFRGDDLVLATRYLQTGACAALPCRCRTAHPFCQLFFFRSGFLHKFGSPTNSS